MKDPGSKRNFKESLEKDSYYTSKKHNSFVVFSREIDMNFSAQAFPYPNNACFLTIF